MVQPDRRQVALVVTALLFVGAVFYVAFPKGASRPSVREGPKSAPSSAARPPEVLRHDAAPVARPEAPSGAPNVVFVMGCTVRRDQLTPYGGPANTTPFLAEFAAQGVRFEDAIATSSWTREASVGLLTGHHAATFDVPEPARGPSRRRLPAEATTLAESLASAGWTTLGITGNPNLNHEFGMGQGFDHYRDSVARGFALRNKIDGEEVVESAIEMLRGRTPEEAARPFYLQVTLIDPHTPRAPLDAELEPFRAPGVPALVVEYRALLHRLDRALARLQSELADADLDPENTLWVFVADHGEGLSMPAHHRGGHGKSMYGSTVQIPWMVRGPGVPAGRTIPGLASGVDVTPTVLGLLGLPALTGVPGQDWSALVRGRGRRTTRKVAFALSMFHNANVASVWTAQRQCQRNYLPLGTDDYEVQDGCFDRQADPGFLTPVLDEAGVARLDRWRDLRLSEGAGRAPVQSEQAPDSQVQRQLEALGYVEPDP